MTQRCVCYCCLTAKQWNLQSDVSLGLWAPTNKSSRSPTSWIINSYARMRRKCHWLSHTKTNWDNNWSGDGRQREWRTFTVNILIQFLCTHKAYIFMSIYQECKGRRGKRQLWKSNLVNFFYSRFAMYCNFFLSLQEKHNDYNHISMKTWEKMAETK